MKLLTFLVLLSLNYLATQFSGENVVDFTFELTVNSQAKEPAKFDIMITGFSLTENGDQIPFELIEQDLETPYKLVLKNGKYTAEIRNKSREVVILSKVQGIRDGELGGSGSSESNQPTLNFGIGGTMSVKDN